MPGVLLGPIQFVDREVPDQIKWGGKQVLAIHRVMGGNRVIDALGPDPEPIEWSGLFYGSSATARARACDELRKSGSEVSLHWGSLSYLVVVSDFQAHYKHEWEVRYSITCEVVSELGAGGGLFSIASLFANDFSAVLAIANGLPAIPAVLGSASITSSMLSLIQAAQTAFNTAAGNQSIEDISLAQLQPTIQASVAAFNSVETVADAAPSGISLDASTATSTLDGFKAFATEAALRAQESDQHIAMGYLGRIVGNLQTLGG